MWPRNTSSCNGFGTCPYFDLCTGGFIADGPLPDKFCQVNNVHPELGDLNNDVAYNETYGKTSEPAAIGAAG